MEKDKRNYYRDSLGNIKALHFDNADDVNNLRVVEKYINDRDAQGYIYLLENFVNGTLIMRQDCGFLLPEWQIYDEDEFGDEQQILDYVEQVPGIRCILGVGLGTDTEVMVKFEDMKRYFRMAADTHKELEPEYAERLEAALQKAEAKLDQYASNRAAYLAEHPEQA